MRGTERREGDVKGEKEKKRDVVVVNRERELRKITEAERNQMKKDRVIASQTEKDGDDDGNGVGVVGGMRMILSSRQGINDEKSILAFGLLPSSSSSFSFFFFFFFFFFAPRK